LLWLRLPWERTRALRLLNLETRLETEQGNAALTDDATFVLMRQTQARLTSSQGSELLNALRKLIGVWPVSRAWEEDDVWQRPLTLSESHKAIETARRAARVVLALQAWKLKHGSLPKSLDQLVGPYLDHIPDDPYSGKPFRYFRDGLKIPLRWDQPLWGWLASSAKGDTIASHEPFIWSTGLKISVSTPWTKDDIFGQYFIRPKWPPGNPRVRNNWPRTANSEYDIWESGWPFPIP